MTLAPLRAGTVLAALVALPVVAHRIALATLRIPLNYNEGWNAYHALSIVRGGPLYPAGDALLLNNYPPLSFYVVAAVGRVTGDLIFAGRLVAFAAFAVVVLNVGLASASVARSRPAGAFAAALFAAMMAAFYARYVGIDDPQMLAHALMTTALVICVRHWDSNRALALAMLLALAAGLVKHNLFAFPIALAAAAVISSPRRGVAVVAGGAALAAGAAALLYFGFGAPLARSLLAPREYSPYAALASVRMHLLPQLLLLACVVVALGTWARRGPELLLLAYAVLAVPIAVLLAGGAGVRENVYFDAVIAGSIVAAVVVTRTVGHGGDPGSRRAIASLPAVLCLAPLLGVMPFVAELKWRWADGEARTAAADTREDTGLLRSAGGTAAMCESLALCYWAGRPAGVDLFNSQQAFRTGRLDRDLLASRLRNGSFGVIQLDAETGERWDPELQQALDARYRPIRTSSNGVFHIPR